MRDRKPVKIVLELSACCKIEGSNESGDGKGCPYDDSERTPGAGFALDHYCRHPSIGKRKTSHYVEWSSDYSEVPAWCPLRMK